MFINFCGLLCLLFKIGWVKLHFLRFYKDSLTSQECQFFPVVYRIFVNDPAVFSFRILSNSVKSVSSSFEGFTWEMAISVLAKKFVCAYSLIRGIFNGPSRPKIESKWPNFCLKFFIFLALQAGYRSTNFQSISNPLSIFLNFFLPDFFVLPVFLLKYIFPNFLLYFSFQFLYAFFIILSRFLHIWTLLFIVFCD